jgi:hypothetical protein
MRKQSPRSKGTRPAGQTPRRPAATALADWSMVTDEKALGLPSAARNSFSIMSADEVKKPPPPL